MSILTEKSAFIQVHAGLKRKLIYTENLMTVINEFTDGPWDKPEPPHSHPHEQTGYMAEGEVIFYCDGEADVHLVKGDMFCVAPNAKHTIKCLTSVVRIIDSFTPLRQDFL
jgi:mannose-6-phosphate isomerase-like protein (cupin superfamily)